MPTQRGYQIDLAFLITTPVHIDGPDSGGTGFFFHIDTNSYLITAGHVLADRERDRYGEEPKSEIRQDPPEISYFLRDTGDIKNATRFTADLSSDQRTWGFDPDGADVAAIRIDENLTPLSDFFQRDEEDEEHQYASFSLTERQFIGSDNLLTDRVFTLGYPGRLYDVQTMFPIRRNALVASPIHFEFEGEQRFLTDARMDPGTSGSPVLVDPSQVIHPWGEHLSQTHEAPVLLGIHSGNFPLVESPESEDAGLRDTRYSDLNETWRPEAIIRAIREAVSG
ncbi:trypsin-like serine peptidase [Halomicrobium salinisoli]|uniref:trypsin-like serine peptidase n=1 Tax=Halomicrobium salinisoli TaxID=2878391 RepID=UPI001CF009E0|nr:serine protease [Halomicrobium salinisoli]